jgi:hypothetical protein
MITVTPFGHIEIPDVPERPIRRRGDTRVDQRPAGRTSPRP